MVRDNRVKACILWVIILLIFYGFGDEALSKKLVLAWIPGIMDSKSLEISQKAIRAKVQEIKLKTNDEIEVVGFESAIHGVADQTKIIEELILKKVDGIALSGIDPLILETIINKAVSSGIPVMCWNSDSPGSKRFTYLGMDDYEGGKKCAEVLIWYMGTSGDVAILAGTPGDKNIDMRIKGFNEFIKDYPDLNVVTTVNCYEDEEMAVRLIEKTMQKHKNLKGWFFTGSWPLLNKSESMPIWEESTQSMKIMNVAMGSLPVDIKLINKGFIKNYTTVRLWNWGYYSIQVLYDHISQGKEYASSYDPLVDKNSNNECQACRNRSVEFW